MCLLDRILGFRWGLRGLEGYKKRNPTELGRVRGVLEIAKLNYLGMKFIGVQSSLMYFLLS